MTRLIIGLGNPGPRYRHTRHNLGFSVVAAVADRRGIRGVARGPAVVGQGSIAGEPVVLAQPTTMMNLSGRALPQLQRAYGVGDLADLLVILDDMDLLLGTIRLRDRGSAGGHRGLQSIIDTLRSREFARLRLGIGRPPPGEDPLDFVLTRFRPEEQRVADEVIQVAADAAECWIEEGPAAAISRFNGWRPEGWRPEGWRPEPQSGA
ncbi:MAG: aminoacyl-tRNA hydrolase [Chloroflexi bacterium]|nr:aminoacyl-tRNA hydrolase [Chloroflexota bacterium]